MKTKVLYLIALICFLAAGCEQRTTMIDTMNDEGKAVMALDYRDFDMAASKMVQSMLGSGALKKPGGGRYVVATGRIVNDTTQRIDTDQLMAKVETEILNSGQAVMTSAIGSGSDELLNDTRQLRDSEEFDPNTVAKRRTLIAPDLTISGKIFQRNIRYDRNTQQIEYYFQLKLSDVKSGLRFWQDETLIGKRGSNRSVSWQ
jgi:uncharacterized protein (TIGR02722 family)